MKSYPQSLPTHPLPVSEKTRLVLKSWREETETEMLRKGRGGAQRSQQVLALKARQLEAGASTE